ncbi:MAG: DUF4175 domain-containing protein [Acetobacteraceae bacterium]|nr:DUF4175 domain-containing protein [Acetobacteraceae bacterium]
MAKLAPNAERSAIIEQAREEWLRVGLSTEPADFDATEAAIATLYESAGRKRPYFVRLSSPLAAELYLNLMLKTRPELGAQLGDQLRDQLWNQLWNQLRDQLRDQLGDQLRDQLRDQLWNQLWNQLRDQLGNQLGDQIRAQLGDQLGDQLWNQIRDQLRDQLWNQLGDQLGDQLGYQLWNQLRDQLGNQLRDQLWNQLGDQIRAQLGDQLGDQQLRFFSTWWWGGWDAYWWGWFDAGRRVGAAYPPELAQRLDAHLAVVRSCGWLYPFADFCILTDRPEIIARDDRNRLHAEDGPALRYRDGTALYAVHGVRMPAWIVEHPERITIETIGGERNQEVRRILIARYKLGEDVSGAAAYLRDSGALIEDKHERWGTLRRRRRDGDSDILMLEVVNRTAEPDGTFKRYHLRIHPELRPMLPDGTLGRPQKPTALNAVASTFGLTGPMYLGAIGALAECES